ncbi:MAG: septation protein A [Bauldia sp.]
MAVESASAASARKPLNPWLKLALDLGPLILFFLANARGERLAERYPWIADLGGPIFFATLTFIVATLVALAVSYVLVRRLPLMPFVTAIVVVVFGGLTLWLQDATFIKMKPTIIYVLFGAVLLGGLALGKPLLGTVFDQVFRLTADGWRKLTLRWGLFFFAMAVVNEIVWRSVSTDAWVSFKVFGFLPLTFAFALAQMPLINRHSLPDEQAEGR